MADSRIDELRRRLERDPGSRLFAQLAEELRKAGQHAEAIRVARTGLAQHPSYPSARLTLGRALLESGDAAGARAELEAALRDAPDNILAGRFLGQALDALGELGPALGQLQKTLKMAPGDRQLESQIVSLETRLRSPQPVPSAAAAGPPSDVTVPMPRPSAPAPAEAEDGALPPTIRIHARGDQGVWGRRAPGPPPLPATAAPAAVASTPAPPPPRPAAVAPAVPAAAASPPVPPPPPTPASVITERLPASTSAIYESDIAPTLPTAHAPGFGMVDEAASPTLPPGAVATEETVFEAEPPPEPPPALETPGPTETSPSEEAAGPGATPFSSSTLAELYLRQGLVDRAVEVYRQLLGEEPDNDRARSRLAELESIPSPAAARAARRMALERTIAGLEALLAVVQRR